MTIPDFKKPLEQSIKVGSGPDGKNNLDNIELRAFLDNDSKMLITIDPGSSQTRVHLNVSCVIDISSYMDTIPCFEESKKPKPLGLTILDIVKYAVATVIKSMDSNDRLAIVTFSDSAYTVLQLMNMDAKGQDMALKTLDCIHSYASCNLWAGLEKGLDILTRTSENDGPNRISTVMLFTAGKPYIIPSLGHLKTLRMYKDRLGCLPGTINTFGFGYFLDSKMLYSLAKEGHGGYYYIRDSSSVGTSIVNAIANQKVTITKTCCLSIEPLNGATFVNPTTDLGEYSTTENSSRLLVDIGSIQTGQTKDILLQMNNLPEEGAAYALISLNVKTRMNISITLSSECDSYASTDRTLPTHFRYMFIDLIKNVMKLMHDRVEFITSANALVQTLIKEIEDAPPHQHSLNLLRELKDEVLEALKPDNFEKWGRHFFPSLVFAHGDQVCNSSKDAGQQTYGGTLFNTLRDEADTLFRNLPPPKPSNRVVQPWPSISPYQEVPRWRNFIMQLFNGNSRYSSGGVCFHGNGSVRMLGGKTKKVETLTKGDRIETINGATATIVCVVETTIAGKELELVTSCSEKNRN